MNGLIAHPSLTLSSLFESAVSMTKARTKSASNASWWIALLCAAAMALPTTSSAATGGFSDRPFVYRANDKKLGELLQDFASSQNIPVVVDPGVNGIVNSNINAKPLEFLNMLSRTYGIIWYYDGTTLFIYPASAMQSKVFTMRGYTRSQVNAMLGTLGLGDPRFPLKFDDANQTLLAYGPPRHIELVSTLLDQLAQSSRDKFGSAIRVVPLKYAVAADRNMGQSTIPGLASTLNSMFTEESAEPTGADIGTSSGPEIASKMRSMQQNYGVKGGGQRSSGGGAAPAIDPGTNGANAQRANSLASGSQSNQLDGNTPKFKAEAGTNSIIIRGLSDRMADYEALVKQLDVAQDLVEIQATIIDVNTSNFEDLGLDWRYVSNGIERLSVANIPGAGGTAASLSNSFLNALSSTANISTVIGNGSRQFLAQIQALQGRGKAEIVSRPRVVGTANRTASMSDKRTASVKVASNLDANLFQIQAGTELKITPQIINYDNERSVRLSLGIKDGNFENVVVGEVPIIKETEINTDAMVGEGESLLIGGIAVDKDEENFTGVPLLSKIPLIGELFKHRSKNKSNMQRLFLITPKIITVGPNRTKSAASGINPNASANGNSNSTAPLQPTTVICTARDLGTSPNCPVQAF